MKERNKAIPAAYLLLKRKDKLYLMRRAGTGYFDGYYSLPAGHVEAGELPLGAMIREAKEETGLRLHEKDLEIINVIYRMAHDTTGDRVDFFFKIEDFKGEPKICELHKCDDAGWFSLNDLPKKITPEVKLAIQCYRRKIIYSEMPFGTKNVNPIHSKK